MLGDKRGYIMPTDKKNDEENSAISLETKLSQLENIVTSMEAGDLPLDKALQQFEHGVNCIKECQKILTEAEQKVETLMQEGKKEDNLD